jgi:hypothetical protein
MPDKSIGAARDQLRVGSAGCGRTPVAPDRGSRGKRDDRPERRQERADHCHRNAVEHSPLERLQIDRAPRQDDCDGDHQEEY